MNPPLPPTRVTALLPARPEALLLGLARRVRDSACAADQNLGHLEEELLRGSHEVFRQMLEKAVQQKTDAAPPLCPHCQNKLSRLTEGHWTTIQTRFGAVGVQRVRGYCRRCRKWRFAADALLGLPEQGTQSPPAQEVAALTVSKMPATEAEQVVERLAGVKISAATLGRAARQQGQRAQGQEPSRWQYQCRFKRPGQFWSQTGDEALMCLETFRHKRALAPDLPSLPSLRQPLKKLTCARLVAGKSFAK